MACPACLGEMQALARTIAKVRVQMTLPKQSCRGDILFSHTWSDRQMDIPSGNNP